MNYQPFLQHLAQSGLPAWAEQLPAEIDRGLNPQRFGDLPRWQQALSQLPAIAVETSNLQDDTITIAGAATQSQQQQLREALKALHPWRKGPFNLFDIFIDTEWRSDWKWQRVQSAIAPLQGRRVLDIGCGSGYHCWRMRGEGAELVMGIEPTPLFICQFFALQHYIQDHRVGVLPLRCERLPRPLSFFDTTFSMGILYHRRSPFDHLLELRDSLRPGGQLVLETLVIEGDEQALLVPQGRYARMGNVWFIPSPRMLQLWLKKVGFVNIELVDVNVTSLEEQRQTDWMQFHSLAQFLDPEDPGRTIEGYPAPRRAILTAQKPD